MAHRPGRISRLVGLLAIAWVSLACGFGGNIADPTPLRDAASTAWEQPTSGTWELGWDAAPFSDAMVFAAWRTTNNQHRYEILESDVPELVGVIYVNDGTQAYQFHRFEEAAPEAVDPALPFAPLDPAFDKITALLQSDAILSGKTENNGNLQRIKLSYPNTTLTLWLDPAANLVRRVELRSQTESLTLAARSLAILSHPDPALFTADAP